MLPERLHCGDFSLWSLVETRAYPTNMVHLQIFNILVTMTQMLTLFCLPGILIKILLSLRLKAKRKIEVKKTTVFFTHAREATLPADFLNANQWASYGQFSGEPNDVQLARFFLLDEADIAFINNRHGRANRLAVALLTRSVRFLGTWPHDLSSIPANVQWFVARQLGISDIGVLSEYWSFRICEEDERD